MPTAHLIHGFLGVGKTTFARQLERKTKAVRFSPDEWVTQIYGSDPPAAQFDDNIQRIYSLVNDLWPRVLTAGSDVILDFGFWTRSFRDEARLLIARAGAELRWYALRCPEDLARDRCRARNLDLRGSFYIAETTYDLLKSRFQPLDADEPCEWIDTSFSLPLS